MISDPFPLIPFSVLGWSPGMPPALAVEQLLEEHCRICAEGHKRSDGPCCRFSEGKQL